MSEIVYPAVLAGEDVILSFNDGSLIFAEAVKGKSTKVKNGFINGEDLISAPYGSVWECVGRGIVRAKDDELHPSIDLDIEFNSMDATDNRNLYDTAHNQSLKSEAIHAMKDEGKSGNEIVKALANASSTFSTKTSFSQEKYLRKKILKHVRRFRIIRCNAQSIAMLNHSVYPDKIMHMRPDSFGLLVSVANIQAGSRVFVYDHTQGLVTGAILERLLPYQSIVQNKNAVKGMSYSLRSREDAAIFSGYEAQHAQPFLSLLNRFNMAKDQRAMRMIYPITMTEMVGWTDIIATMEDPTLATTLESVEEDSSGAAAADGEGEKPGEKRAREEKAVDPKSLRHEKPTMNLPRRSNAQRQRALSGGFTSIVVAAPQDPLHVVLAALRYARAGCTLAVFHTDLHALAHVQRQLRALGVGVALTLTELWTREYQVLPNRTHPDMQMHAASGFVLFGQVVPGRFSALPCAKAREVFAARMSAAMSQKKAREALHMQMMRTAISLARKCTSAQTAYNVGALAFGSLSGSSDGQEPAEEQTTNTTEVLATGFSREIEGNTHAEEVVLMKLFGNDLSQQSYERIKAIAARLLDSEMDTKGLVQALVAENIAESVEIAETLISRAVNLSKFQNSTLISTMEPCSTRLSGKTSCSELLQRWGCGKVILAVKEPPHFVKCQGITSLKKAGVSIEFVDDADVIESARALNAHITSD